MTSNHPDPKKKTLEDNVGDEVFGDTCPLALIRKIIVMEFCGIHDFDVAMSTVKGFGNLKPDGYLLFYIFSLLDG